MGFIEVLRLGIDNLIHHPGRSLLTMLGILFGVCAVIATMAVVEGISERLQEEVRRMGATNIIIEAAKPPQDESVAAKQGGAALVYGLTYADAARIQSSVHGAEVVVPARKISVAARYRTRGIRVTVLGTVPWYLETYGLRIAQGRWLTPVDLDKTANVCVLGAAAARDLFPQEDPVGLTVRLGDDYYRIVGVASTRGKTSGQTKATEDFDRIIYIPLTAASHRFGEILADRSTGTRSLEICELHEITVKLARPEDVRPAERIITGLLERFHDPKGTDWKVQVPLKQLETLERTKWLFIVLGVSIAAISQIVGGIGIMNIKLAAVTERTREIGIRRAMGAKRRDIIHQFLVETVLLSVIGGTMGIPAGIGLAMAIPRLLTKAAAMLGIGGEAVLMQFSRTIVTPWAVILALGTSLVVGVVSGVYPAYRAAQMDPIQALRHE